MSMKTAAIYARVSSDQQKQDKTIASQTAALAAFASSHGYSVPDDWIFEDEGFSGATLVRPGLERVRDLVAEGRVTFTDKNLQHRVSLIVRVNQRTATLDCDGQQWRVGFELLRHLVDV
jgi:DNA invertase Pin-like site-specific DNA recombinase